jgi:hypothetical protein
LVLPIVGLDIGAIGSGNSIVLWFRLDEYSPALVLIIYLYQKARQRFRADEYKIPHHRQYLLVVRHLI